MGAAEFIPQETQPIKRIP